jgi:hypothetical protein
MASSLSVAPSCMTATPIQSTARSIPAPHRTTCRAIPHARHAQIARRVIGSHHFGIAEIPKSVTHSAHPASTRGTLRPIVTKREAGKRWTRWRAGRSARMRPTKPCGPDTPMLVSSLRERATVTRRPGTPRRARNKSSNIARGMPDVFGCTCDHSCAFSSYSCTRDRGCNGARHSLRPLPDEGGK